MLMHLTAKREERSRGKLRVICAPMSERRNFWTAILCNKFKKLSAVAVMILSMHTTSCSAERNWSKWGLIYEKNRARLGLERAMKMIFLSEHHVFLLNEESDVLDLS